MALNPNDKAPDFGLSDLKKNRVKLSDYKGKEGDIFCGACRSVDVLVGESFLVDLKKPCGVGYHIIIDLMGGNERA